MTLMNLSLSSPIVDCRLQQVLQARYVRLLECLATVKCAQIRIHLLLEKNKWVKGIRPFRLHTRGEFEESTCTDE